MPCYKQAFKPGFEISNQHRINMLELVCKLIPSFGIERYEIDSHETTYTVETLTHFTQQNPQQHLVFVMGMDSFNQLCAWSQWQRIVELCHIVVLGRNAQQAQTLPANVVQSAYKISSSALDQVSLCQQYWRAFSGGSVTMCEIDEIDISSTQLKTLIRQRHDIAELVPTTINDYIKQHNLYCDN